MTSPAVEPSGMDENGSPIKGLLAHRKLTRAMGHIITAQMKEYVGVLAPLFRQRALLGEHIQGAGGEAVKAADANFKELQAAYDTIATAAPFHLANGLRSPLLPMSPALELAPWEYEHSVNGPGESKKITVTSPYKAVLVYAGYAPRRLPDLLNDRARNNGELEQFVLHYLVMHLVIAKQPGLTKVMETLHFPLASARLPGFGSLPITCVGSEVSTALPSNDAVMESTDLSGTDNFEELVNAEDVQRLEDAFKNQLENLISGSKFG